MNGRPTSVEARGQQQATKRTAGHNWQRGSGQGPRTSVEAVRVCECKSSFDEARKTVLGFWRRLTTRRRLNCFDDVEGISMYEDKDEWDVYKVVGQDEVVHIELRRWADVLLIAPTSANTLAKLAQGLCDNLLLALPGHGILRGID